MVYQSTPKQTKILVQAEVNELWSGLKKSKSGPIDQVKYDVEVNKLKSLVEKREGSQKSIHSFLKRKGPPANANNNKPAEVPSTSVEEVITEVHPPSIGDDDGASAIVIDGPEQDDDQAYEQPEIEIEYQTPKQEALKAEILEKEGALGKLLDAKILGLETETAEKINKRIKSLRLEITMKKKELKRKENIQKAVQKHRVKKRKAEEKLLQDNPEVARALKIRDGVGRPRVEVDQPGLLNDILKIATIGAACGDKRRDDIFRTVKTLDDLKTAIDALGYTVSRQALYLRLLPRDAKSLHGQKHVNTVNVRLVRPSNDMRKKHPDRVFARESCRGVDEIVTYFGPGSAVFLGQDDKSSVPLGVPCAKKQSSILMNMRVRVRLPDHDFESWKSSSPHTLSAGCVSHHPGGGELSYTGPTYVAIRSSKHNGSTTFSHNEDLEKFMKMKPEVFLMKGSETEVKPILVKSVDGGPDENPRFFNNIVMGCKTFKEMGLDCYIEVTNVKEECTILVKMVPY